MDQKQREALLTLGGARIHFDCPMDKYTTFRIGGKAEALFFAEQRDELQGMVSFLRQEGIPYLVVGKGSNLLVRDEGFDGVVMLLGGELAAVEKDRRQESVLIAGAGLGISELLSFCRREGLAGLEFLAGIPGTVGGALAMNAGAWGREMEGVVRDIEVLSPQADFTVQDRSKLAFLYRALSIPDGSVIVRGTFVTKPESPESIAQRLADYLAQRKKKQPLDAPSAGSVFKNPPGDYAARLIEGAGLKGRRMGGAMISPKHANFIVNTGGATAEDVLALIELARERVQEETDTRLELELKVVGKKR
jgi:UDP-N-acetylmuramate dehydrogenase